MIPSGTPSCPELQAGHYVTGTITGTLYCPEHAHPAKHLQPAAAAEDLSW